MVVTRSKIDVPYHVVLRPAGVLTEAKIRELFRSIVGDRVDARDWFMQRDHDVSASGRRGGEGLLPLNLPFPPSPTVSQDIVNTRPGEPIVLFYSPRKFREIHERWLLHYLQTGDERSFLPEQEVLDE